MLLIVIFSLMSFCAAVFSSNRKLLTFAQGLCVGWEEERGRFHVVLTTECKFVVVVVVVVVGMTEFPTLEFLHGLACMLFAEWESSPKLRMIQERRRNRLVI
jgi:hypothetical protein